MTRVRNTGAHRAIPPSPLAPEDRARLVPDLSRTGSLDSRRLPIPERASWREVWREMVRPYLVALLVIVGGLVVLVVWG